MSRVIHTGQALVDLVLRVDDLPRRGGNVMADEGTRYAAGSVNILLAAARSGAECVLAGAHGTGPNGDLIRSALEAEGVSVVSEPVADLDSGVCVVLVEPTGERTFVTTRAAERLLTVDRLAASEPGPGDLVCLTGYSLVGRTRDPLLEWLDRLDPGVLVVLDPGAIFADLEPALRERVLARTSVWTSNADEARALVGAGDEIDLAQAARAVASLLPEGAVVIVRDGPAGCVVHERGATTDVPGYPRKPIDTNGAGDAHTGVLVAEAAQGTDWVTAARRGNAAGAIKVTREGPATAPTRAEIDAFLAAEEGQRP